MAKGDRAQAHSVADELRGLGVRGILVVAAEEGRITELACQMEECLCPEEMGGRRYFEPAAPDLPDWMPSHEHHPIPKRLGGKRTVDNSLLAHRLCNRVGYAKSIGQPHDGDRERAERARLGVMGAPEDGGTRTMRIQHIIEGEVAFWYDHRHGEKPRVGDSYYLTEATTGEALVVQVMALETTEPKGAPGEGADRALSQIRRHVVNGEWLTWDGWIPSGQVETSRVEDQELLERCGLRTPRHPLKIGTTLGGTALAIEGQRFEKVNVITALKGMGKSHLAKVLLLELMNQGMPCIVFDINREYGNLPGVEVLTASKNFKLAIRDFGITGLIELFGHFGATEKIQNYVDEKLGALFTDRDVEPSAGGFLSVDDLRRPFLEGSDTMNTWTRRLFDQIERLNLLASTEEEGDVFRRCYEQIETQGGCLVIDLALLETRFTREAFVGATLRRVESRSQDAPRPPFVFFEEAHLYTAPERIESLVTRARHLGVTCTFVTNTVTALNESVLRQVDNLFLMYLPHRDDVRHIAKSATVDMETIEAFAQRMDRYHALLVGAASGSYPIVFKVADPEGVNMAGATKYAFGDPA